MLLNIIKISILSLVSKIISFIRDILIANIFGINFQTDCFYTAFKLSNMLRKIFAEGAFSYVIIPILGEYKKNKDKKKIKEFISSIYFILFLILLIISIIGIIYSKNIIFLTSPGFINDKLKLNLINKILKITFPYIILISLTTYLSSILNIWNLYFLPTFSPIILNITIIFFSLFLNKYFDIPILCLSWSIIFAGIFQLIFQKIILKNIPIKILFNKFNIYNEGILKVFINIIPISISMFIYQISQILNNNILSYLKDGSISWIYYADRLIEFPLGILGNTIGTILLSKLSTTTSNIDNKKYSKLINKYLKITILFSTPISVIVIFLSKTIVITIFKYGKFSNLDVIMTSKTLIAFSIGLIGLIFSRILTPCIYTKNNKQTPINLALITLITTQLINLITIKFLKHTGLALSISISSYINNIVLFIQLKKNNILKFHKKWTNFFIKIFISNILMSIILKIIIPKLTYNFINLNIKFRLIKLFIILFISITTYICSLLCLNFKINKIINL